MGSPNAAALKTLAELSTLDKLGIATWVCFGVAVVTTIARLYARIFVVRQFGLEDVLICIAKVSSVATVPLVHLSHKQFAHVVKLAILHAKDPVTPRRVNALRVQPTMYAWILVVIYPTAITVLKISILAFYRRFMPRRPYHRIIYTFAAFLAIIGLAVSLHRVVDCCGRMRMDWERCTQFRLGAVLSIAFNALHLLADVFILLLPIPVVVRMHTDAKKKVALVVIFSLGAVGTAATALRLWMLARAYRFYDRAPRRSPRMLVEFVQAMLLSDIEFCLIATCANLPALFAWAKQCRLRRRRRRRQIDRPHRPSNLLAGAAPKASCGAATDSAAAAAAAAPLGPDTEDTLGGSCTGSSGSSSDGGYSNGGGGGGGGGSGDGDGSGGGHRANIRSWLPALKLQPFWQPAEAAGSYN